MRKALLILLTLAALWIVAPTGAHPTKATWSTYDAEQRLTVGRFAATNAIRYATCLGTGAASGPSYNREFKHFECKVQDAELEREKQLVLHVRGETTFSVVWLEGKLC